MLAVFALFLAKRVYVKIETQTIEFRGVLYIICNRDIVLRGQLDPEAERMKKHGYFFRDLGQSSMGYQMGHAISRQIFSILK